jgi:hypothetical protein
MIEEITGLREENTREQRWSHFLTAFVAVLMLLYGLNMRNSALTASSLYANPEAGIRVRYPQNWLIDESDDYVLRVRDMSRIGFKTTILVSTRPVGSFTSERNIRDQLILERADNLIGYQSFTTEPYILSDESEGLRTDYAFVEAEINPSSETTLIPVHGTDIILIRGSQAIIITFLANAETFDDEFAYFSRFLNSLELF